MPLVDAYAADWEKSQDRGALVREDDSEDGEGGQAFFLWRRSFARRTTAPTKATLVDLLIKIAKAHPKIAKEMSV